MSKFMIEDAQITKASTFEPIVQGDTPEVVNIASTLGKVAQYHDEIANSTENIQKLNDGLVSYMDGGSTKNLVPLAAQPTSGNTQISGTISDGIVTLSTAAAINANTAVAICDRTFYLSAGVTYVISGCPGNGAIRIFLTDSNGVYLVGQFGDGVEYTPQTSGYYGLIVFMYSGVNVQGFQIYPMICTKEQWDVSHSFVPYSLPVTTITPGLIELVDNGTKNLSSINTITLSATSSSVGMLYYFDKPIPAGTYNLSFSGTVSNSTAIRWITTPISETAAWSGGFDFNQSNLPYSNTLTLTAPIYGIRLWINSNSSANLTNIMICPKGLYNISSTYEPYALPNADLTYKISNAMRYIDGSTGVGRYKFQIGLKPGYTNRLRIPVRITCSSQQLSMTPFVINVTMKLDSTLSKQITFDDGIAMFHNAYGAKPLIAYQYTSETSIAVNLILTNISSAWGKVIVEMPGFLTNYIIFLTDSGPDITPVYSGDDKNVLDLYAPTLNLISY